VTAPEKLTEAWWRLTGSACACVEHGGPLPVPTVAISPVPTRWRFHDCDGGCGTVYVTGHEYQKQCDAPPMRWTCPRCNKPASLDINWRDAYGR